MSWIQKAENLPQGHKTRGDCPEACGDGGSLSIVNDSKRLWCSCFRCGFTDQHDKGKQTLGELQRIRELNEQALKEQLTLELPSDYTEDIPLIGRLWLYKAGITESVWRRYRLGFSELLQRVILPVFDSTGKCIWYQCRALHKGQTPKYLQPARDRSKIMFTGRCSGKYERAVIAEDILSAIRLSKHTDSYSLLGTKITTAQAAILSKYKKVTTWLDSDAAGRTGSYKIRATLSLVTNVSDIVTDKDPKMLSDAEIIECLERHKTKDIV